ncbi:twin-arginine translocation signal domain-containing protein [Bradyrhizobium sp. USDA 4353]
MERRDFLKLAFGLGCVAAGGMALRTTESVAAPLAPVPLNEAIPSRSNDRAERAVGSQDEADRLTPEQVHWGHRGHGRHWGWRRRHWGWRHHHRQWRRRWHRRHYW